MARPLSLLAALMMALFATLPARAGEPLTVLLDWFVNPDHAPLVIAKQAGYFDDAGLDVTLVPPADPSAPPRLVAAGEGDVAISYQPNLYQQVAEGLPLKRFGTIVATPLNSLVLLADGPVKSIADLKGRKVGFSVAGFEDALLAAVLKTEGLTLDDVERVNINFSLSPSLISGNVDAVIGAFRNFEITQLRIEGHEGKAFFLEEHGVPPYDELIFIAREDRLDDPKLAAFLSAVERATIFLTNHPEEAWKLFIAAHPDLDDELNRQAFTDTLPRFSKSPAAFDAARYARFATFMKDAGLIPEALPVSSYSVMPK
ncbi:MAG: ABC transporter ATP-binding protein [Hyphomicrobiales bacterium]|nr:MAG: ABC transporter ATP-binding protein [Hyphomicrobiales bacterium]